MKISEAATITGIDAQNIRFYEKQGLLSPERTVSSMYRNYGEEDIRRLKEIKLLRKLGISVADIELILNGVLTLPAALRRREAELNETLDRLGYLKGLCSEMEKQAPDLAAIDPDHYLEKIDTLETRGVTFSNIVRDYAQKFKSALPGYRKFVVEPREPVLNRKEMTCELIDWAQKEGKNLTILREGMMPLIELDGKKYMCQLETPRTLDLPFPFSAFFFYTRSYGFKFIYIYEYQD